MPPTLIASIYGMNFKNMPELEWHYGYPMALVLIMLAAALPYCLFQMEEVAVTATRNDVARLARIIVGTSR